MVGAASGEYSQTTDCLIINLCEKIIASRHRKSAEHGRAPTSMVSTYHQRAQ